MIILNLGFQCLARRVVTILGVPLHQRDMRVVSVCMDYFRRV